MSMDVHAKSHAAQQGRTLLLAADVAETMSRASADLAKLAGKAIRVEGLGVGLGVYLDATIAMWNRCHTSQSIALLPATYSAGSDITLVLQDSGTASWHVWADITAAGWAVASLELQHLYGPGMPEEHLLARVVTALRRREPVTLAGGGTLPLTPCYVTDATVALLQLLASETPVGDCHLTRSIDHLTERDMLVILGDVIGHPIPTTSGPAALAPSRLPSGKLLDISSRVPLADGLARTMDSAMRQAPETLPPMVRRRLAAGV